MVGIPWGEITHWSYDHLCSDHFLSLRDIQGYPLGGSSQLASRLVTSIYKPFGPFIRGITPFRGLTITMVVNHLLTGMILQGYPSFPTLFQESVAQVHSNHHQQVHPNSHHPQRWSYHPSCHQCLARMVRWWAGGCNQWFKWGDFFCPL